MSLINIIDNKTRIGLLKNKLKEKKCLKIIEVHNGISGLIADNYKLRLKNGKTIEFDGLWESSFTDSASKGYPDIEVVSLDSRLETVNQILEVTKKPLIFDGDTGGDFSQFEYMVKRLERAGVSMVIIEDKVSPKRNSLESGTKQELENIEVFAEKIRRGLKVRNNPNFMIVARIESLIAGRGLADALERVETYLKAGADGIMIHSKSSDPQNILEFAKEFYKFPKSLIRNKVLVCVPTTYNTIKDQKLAQTGFNIIIHANHLLRAAYKAMENICQKILLCDRSLEADSDCASVREIFKKVGFLKIKEKDREVADKLKSKIKVIIPAAGTNILTRLYKKPVSLLDINGKTVLERQTETLNQAGLDNIVVIKGYQARKFNLENIKYYTNKNYQKGYILDSLFCAQDEMEGPFIYLNSDILFNQNIINSLITLENDTNNNIVLVADNSYEYHKHKIDKELDVLRTKKTYLSEPIRQILDITDERVEQIGKKLDQEEAQYEFIGVAYFSAQGAKILKKIYRSLKNHRGKFHEASSKKQASFTDIIQEIINRDYPVKILKTYKGWMEIHNQKDLKLAREIYR